MIKILKTGIGRRDKSDKNYNIGEENEEYLSIEESDYKSPKEIQGSRLKVKAENFLESHFFIALVILFVGISSFTLGRLSKIDGAREPVRIEYKESVEKFSDSLEYNKVKNTATVIKSQQNLNSQTTKISNSGQVVASKNGVRYHYPWCSGAKRISPKNMITFNSIKEAQKAGYTPAANCKGLK